MRCTCSASGLQCAAEDAGRTAGACEIPARHDRSAEAAGDRAFALPEVQSQAPVARADRRSDAPYPGCREVEFDDEALECSARGADGSLRDGLSLLDQAIAYGGGALDCGGCACDAGHDRAQPSIATLLDACAGMMAAA